MRTREVMLRAAHRTGHGHLPSSYSVLEMLRAVYSCMRHDPKRPDDSMRDILILSKGHAAMALYAVMAEHGYLDMDELYTFGLPGSRLPCHPDRTRLPGVECSTGSLGHGLGVAVGMAMATAGTGRRVFCLFGDGEFNEGECYPALQIASFRKLTHLSFLYDQNESQDRCLPIPNPAAVFSALGLVPLFCNGHNEQSVYERLMQPVDGVRVLIARTVNGKGSPTMEADPFAWHRRSPTDAELPRMVEELYA